MITYTARFETADQADRAAAILRSRGVQLCQYRAGQAKQTREPGLIIGTPYGYPANSASPNYTTGLINGLPQTDGSTVIYPLPFGRQSKIKSVDAQFTVRDADAPRTRRMLINSGGAGVQIVQ